MGNYGFQTHGLKLNTLITLPIELSHSFEMKTPLKFYKSKLVKMLGMILGKLQL